MKNKTKQDIGIVLGFIIAMIGAYMLEPLQSRYFFGILFVNAGLLIGGTCAYHHSMAKHIDKQNNAFEVIPE